MERSTSPWRGDRLREERRARENPALIKPRFALRHNYARIISINTYLTYLSKYLCAVCPIKSLRVVTCTSAVSRSDSGRLIVESIHSEGSLKPSSHACALSLVSGVLGISVLNSGCKMYDKLSIFSLSRMCTVARWKYVS